MKKILAILLVAASAHAQVKISELPAASTINSGDSAVIVQSGITKKAAISLWDARFPTLTSNNTWTGTNTFNGTLAFGNATQVKSALSLNNVENTALSTWTGSTNLATLASTEARVIRVTKSGSDSTGAIGTEKPYSTVSAAYAAAKSATPTSISPVLIKIGAGTFAESALAMDTDYISLAGSGASSTTITFSSGGLTTTAGNLSVSNLSILGTGTNVGPLFSSASPASGTSGGGQYKSGVTLQSVNVTNPYNSTSAIALGGFFGIANDCAFSSTYGIAVDLLWGGSLNSCTVTGNTYGIKTMIAYWPNADPFGAKTKGSPLGSASNINAAVTGGRVQATGNNGIAVHGLCEDGNDWTATVSGEAITNSPVTVANPPILSGVYIFGPMYGSTSGAAATGTLTITGCTLWGTTCIRDLHDCYVIGNYINQFPFSGYVVQKVYNVGFVGNSIVADNSSQVYRWLGGNTAFAGCYFEGDSSTQFESANLVNVKGGCTDSNGAIGADAGSASTPSINFRSSKTTGLYDAAGMDLGFARASVGRMWIRGTSIGFMGTKASPEFMFNEASGGAALGYYALQFKSDAPWTIGNADTGARHLSGLADGSLVTAEADFRVKGLLKTGNNTVTLTDANGNLLASAITGLGTAATSNSTAFVSSANGTATNLTINGTTTFGNATQIQTALSVVPYTRTINGVDLSANRTLDDIGAASVRAIKSGNFTASINGRYTTNGTLTVTDPTGTAAGQVYSVIVGSGNATIGGNVYPPSRLEIMSYYNGSAWSVLPRYRQTYAGSAFEIGTGQFGLVVLAAGGASTQPMNASSFAVTSAIATGSQTLTIDTGGTFVKSTGRFGFSSLSSSGQSYAPSNDLALSRGAAKVLSLNDDNANGATLAPIPSTPSQIASDQNNYNPAGSGLYLRLSSDASRTLTGLTFTAAQVAGQTHVLVNVGSQNIVIANESASSTAANRFHNSTGADITLAPDGELNCWYDSTTNRWRVTKRGF